jgi:cystathionine gamma-lyase
VAALAREAGALTVVDNTFATPYLQRPLDLGADLVMHSATKYLGGHSDVVGGAVVGRDPALRDELAFLQNAAGAVPGPLDAWLVLRGLKTLALRMERHSSNAYAVACALEGRPGVERVLYPGLASHPQHDLAERVLRDGMAGGMLSLDLAGGRPAGEAFLGRLRVAVHATSLGSAETLCSHPASSSHRQLDDEALALAGMTPGMVRVSIGLEDPDDIVEDFLAAIGP